MAGKGGLGEFELIARYLAPLSAGVSGAFGLQDDAALLKPPPGCDLVITTDAMIEGIHFLEEDGAERIARKLLRVNLSDLAAKGAVPLGYQLVLGLPAPLDEAWLAGFAAGLAQDQQIFGFPLYGGDTTRSPAGLMLAVTAFGTVPAGGMLRRSGGMAGDHLYVTGCIGDAALGLEAKLNRRQFSSEAMALFDLRLHLPIPRLAFGQSLQPIAHAAMDVSDGLIQDAGHIAAASGLRLVINAEAVPLSPAAQDALAHDPSLLGMILAGGDDYEILFTAASDMTSVIDDLSNRLGVSATRIGHLEAGSGVAVLDRSGKPLVFGQVGFQHFGGRLD